MTEQIDFKGISTFAYFAIPAVLAIAAIWWLAFGEGLHYFRRALSQEKRHAEIVGAISLPKAPLKIELTGQRDSIIAVERAEIDGGDLWVYYRNEGQGPKSYIQFRWQQVAPDGTVVKADDGFVEIGSENNAPGELDGGQRGEMHRKIPTDPRAVTLRLSIY